MNKVTTAITATTLTLFAAAGVVVLNKKPVPESMTAAETRAATFSPSVKRIDSWWWTLGGQTFCAVNVPADVVQCKGIKRRYWFVAIEIADEVRRHGGPLVGDRYPSPSRGTMFWPEHFAVGSWMVCPIENDSNGDQHVRFAYLSGPVLTPTFRIKDLGVMSVAELTGGKRRAVTK